MSEQDLPNSPSSEVVMGHVLFILSNKGTKSESLAPYLISEPGNILRLHVDGENPFTEPTLRAFHGTYCKLHVKRYSEKQVALVEEICSTQDPLFRPEEPST